MARYATGKYAKAISDRSGLEYRYKDMRKEWTGALVVSTFSAHRAYALAGKKLGEIFRYPDLCRCSDVSRANKLDMRQIIDD